MPPWSRPRLAAALTLAAAAALAPAGCSAPAAPAPRTAPVRPAPPAGSALTQTGLAVYAVSGPASPAAGTRTRCPAGTVPVPAPAPACVRPGPALGYLPQLPVLTDRRLLAGTLHARLRLDAAAAARLAAAARAHHAARVLLTYRGFPLATCTADRLTAPVPVALADAAGLGVRG